MGKVLHTVTDADRRAADNWRREFKDCIGEHTALVQAFAAHRIEAREQALEDAARMIDGSDGMIPYSTAFVPLILGHNQPCMSGDMRDRLHPSKRRQFDDAAKALAAAIRALKEGRDHG